MLLDWVVKGRASGMVFEQNEVKEQSRRISEERTFLGEKTLEWTLALCIRSIANRPVGLEWGEPEGE